MRHPEPSPQKGVNEPSAPHVEVLVRLELPHCGGLMLWGDGLCGLSHAGLGSRCQGDRQARTRGKAVCA